MIFLLENKTYIYIHSFNQSFKCSLYTFIPICALFEQDKSINTRVKWIHMIVLIFIDQNCHIVREWEKEKRNSYIMFMNIKRLKSIESKRLISTLTSLHQNEWMNEHFKLIKEFKKMLSFFLYSLFVHKDYHDMRSKLTVKRKKIESCCW